MREGIVARKGYISIDGVEYIPRRQLDEVRVERDRLAAELERLREEFDREKESRDET